jgi:hypothetical protein
MFGMKKGGAWHAKPRLFPWVGEPLSAQELLRCFQIERDGPLLRGVVLELRALQEISMENAAVARGEERAEWCGAVRMLGEAQERLLALVEQAWKEKENPRGKGKGHGMPCPNGPSPNGPRPNVPNPPPAPAKGP